MIRMLLLKFVLRGFWVFDGAMRRYEEGVLPNLAHPDCPHRWWRTLRESVFGVEQSVPIGGRARIFSSCLPRVTCNVSCVVWPFSPE